MQLRLVAPVVLCVLAAAAACSSDDDDKKSGTGGGSGTGATGGSSGSGGATGGSGGATGGAGGATGGAGGASGSGGTGGMEAGVPVKVSGNVTEFQQSIPEGGGPKPLADVKVCESGTSNCTTTDASGDYTLTVPSNLESVLLFTKATYANTAIAGLIPPNDSTANVSMPTEIIGGLFAKAAGFAWPLAGSGIIIAFSNQVNPVDGGDGATIRTGLAGSTFALTPASGVGPVYVDTAQFPDKAATTTTDPGWGGWGDLPPATYTVKVTNPGRTCTPQFGGWPSTAAESQRVPVVADFITNAVNFDCN